MTIKELKEIVDKAFEFSNGGEAEVIITLISSDNEEIHCKINRIGQFNVSPDIVFDISTDDEKELYVRKLSEEQADYKKKFELLNYNMNVINEIAFKSQKAVFETQNK